MMALRRFTLVPLGALTLGCLLASCGSQTPSASYHSHRTSPAALSAVDQNTCLTALHALGIPTQSISPPSDVSTSPNPTEIRLAGDLSGGAYAPNVYTESSVETAYEDTLSSAVGYPLTAHLGSRLSEVQLTGGPQGMAGYTCLESHGKVVGLWGISATPNQNPESFVTAKGPSIETLTGQDVLSWLLANRYYAPKAVPNSPSFSAEQALAASFAVLNDRFLPTAEKERLYSTYFVSTQAWRNVTTYSALVPFAITPTGPFGRPSPSKTQAEFSVAQWPEFIAATPSASAGNGGVYLFYTLVRPAGSSLWKIASVGTGV